ncbi:MAG: GtrA family protein [Chloroflexi bacterium]|nr:GtrA family protein [Chloroflexota bacterium]
MTGREAALGAQTGAGVTVPGDNRATHPRASLLARALVGARYLAAGVGSLVGDLAFQGALISGAGLSPTVAIPVSYELSLIAHFFLNDRWVFARGSYGPVRPRPAWQRLLAFQLSALVPQVVTIGIALFLVDGPWAAQFADWWGSYVAKVLGTGAGFLWNFAVNFLVIWRPAPAGERQDIPASTR